MENTCRLKSSRLLPVIIINSPGEKVKTRYIGEDRNKTNWTYGIQPWGSAARFNIKILERFQARLLITATNTPRYVSKMRLREDLGVNAIIKKSAEAIKYMDIWIGRGLLQERAGPVVIRLKRKRPLHSVSSFSGNLKLNEIGLWGKRALYKHVKLVMHDIKHQPTVHWTGIGKKIGAKNLVVGA